MIDFLYSKSNVISKEICDSFITSFEKSSLKQMIDAKLSDGSIHKKSTDIHFKNDTKSEWYINEKDIWMDLLFELYSVINKNLKEYTEIYPEINQLPPIECDRFNFQKYNPGEGFGGWHFESNYGTGTQPYGNSSRKLVWMIYLNDVDDGGTEFKYQKHKETAECGKLLIWPAEWMFTHKGEISNTKTKYILTGWFEDFKFDELP